MEPCATMSKGFLPIMYTYIPEHRKFGSYFEAGKEEGYPMYRTGVRAPASVPQRERSWKVAPPRRRPARGFHNRRRARIHSGTARTAASVIWQRSEEHTPELQ